MKKFFLSLLLFSSCTYTQKLNTVNLTTNISDTLLLKYSYPIVGLKGDSIYQSGTGFFFKTNDGYRFITAKHIVSQISTFNKEILPQYDFIGIIYNDTITKKLATIRLDIRQVKPLLPNTFFYETPDMTVFNFSKININARINSIETLFPNRDTTYKELQTIIAFGYPKNSTAKNVNDFRPYKYEGRFAANSTLAPYYPKDSINFKITPGAEGGMSGSPVFLKYSKKENGKTIYFFEFGGLLIGAGWVYDPNYITKQNIAVMIRQNIALDELFKATIFTYTF